MFDYYQYIAGYQYWSWMGTLYLIFLTWKDFKNNRVIDDRHNYVMIGASSALFSHIHRPIWYILMIMALILALNFYLKYFQLIGGADITAISWIFLGYSILGMTYAAWWFIFFSIITGFYTFLKHGVLKNKQETPFFGVILATFILTNFVMGIY